MFKPFDLPPRYAKSDWRGLFRSKIADALVPGMTVLDVGSGRHATVPPQERPADVRWAGMDVSAMELAAAEPGSYDDLVVADVANWLPEHAGRYDLIVSWQVLEHVRSLPSAIHNLRRYLRPGGTMVLQLSGRNSLFAIANRALPHAIGKQFMTRVLNRRPDSVFPAVYDHCTYTEIIPLLDGMDTEVTPRFLAATYLRFFRPLQRMYLVLEEWMIRKHLWNLASHYMIVARVPDEGAGQVNSPASTE